MKKGLVVVICGYSQGGKDFIISKTMQNLAHSGQTSSYGTAYKIRDARANDGEHIKCVSSEDEIPIVAEDRIEATIYGTQTVVYDKKEIARKIENGEIVFIATANPELAKKIKAQFGELCFNVYVRVQQVATEYMINEDLNRYGVDKTTATQDLLKASERRVNARVKAYESMKPQMRDFVKDSVLGANYIFNNFHTLIGGSWNQVVDGVAENEFTSLYLTILNIMRCINQGEDWSCYSMTEEERNVENLFSLVDVWNKYLERKHDDVIL